MSWRYDPSVTSQEYLKLARKRHRTNRIQDPFVGGIFSDRFDYGVHSDHVRRLLDPKNWNPKLAAEGRRPRVFIDLYVNQRGNVEVRCFGGPRLIEYMEDFEPRYFGSCQGPNHGTRRSAGELMWLQNFIFLEEQAVRKRSPIAKALLFGFKARLGELAREVSGVLDVVGAMEVNFEYERQNVRAVTFLSNRTDAEMEVLEEDALQRHLKVLKDAIKLIDERHFNQAR